MREAIDLKRNCENYRRAKEKGRTENELMLQIAQQYYELQIGYQKELIRIESNEEQRQYFKENYEVTYYKFFKLLDNIFFQDLQLQTIGQLPSHLAALNRTNLADLHPNELYDFLKKLAPYRQISAQVPQIEGDLFYKIRDKINQIENLFYPQVFIVPSSEEKSKRIEKLSQLQQEYRLCQLCDKETSEKITRIQQSIEDEQRTALFALQNKQLKYQKCFSELQLKALAALKLRYPNQDSLSKVELTLYSAYLSKINQLEKEASAFNQISTLSIEKIPREQLADTFNHYNSLLTNFTNEACQLYHGEILKKEDLICIGQACKVMIP